MEILRTTALLVVALLGLAGCSSGSDDGPSSIDTAENAPKTMS